MDESLAMVSRLVLFASISHCPRVALDTCLDQSRRGIDWAWVGLGGDGDSATLSFIAHCAS